MKNVLMIVTAADAITLRDGTAHPTGFWAEELVIAHRSLRDAGHAVTIATPGGVAPTVDAVSLDPAVAGEHVASFRDYLDAIRAELEHPVALDAVDAAAFDAVVLPGGHGPMADLAADADLGALLVAADANGAVIAPFCHGPAGLISAVRPDGSFAFAGRRMTVFTDEEELAGGTGENTPWFVEERLRSLGAVIESGAAWTSHVVIDGTIISGQNPQSSAAVAAAVIAALDPSEA